VCRGGRGSGRKEGGGEEGKEKKGRKKRTEEKWERERKMEEEWAESIDIWTERKRERDNNKFKK
jgi:hypothetical protein